MSLIEIFSLSTVTTFLGRNCCTPTPMQRIRTISTHSAPKTIGFLFPPPNPLPLPICFLLGTETGTPFVSFSCPLTIFFAEFMIIPPSINLCRNLPQNARNAIFYSNVKPSEVKTKFVISWTRFHVIRKNIKIIILLHKILIRC